LLHCPSGTLVLSVTEPPETGLPLQQPEALYSAFNVSPSLTGGSVEKSSNEALTLSGSSFTPSEVHVLHSGVSSTQLPFWQVSHERQWLMQLPS
jgi:hypothetical protein